MVMPEYLGAFKLQSATPTGENSLPKSKCPRLHRNHNP
jgi:hypothetical protein